MQFLLENVRTDVKFIDSLVYKNQIETDFRFSAHYYLRHSSVSWNVTSHTQVLVYQW